MDRVLATRVQVGGVCLSRMESKCANFANGVKETTNNSMEIQAAIEAVKVVERSQQIDKEVNHPHGFQVRGRMV